MEIAIPAPTLVGNLEKRLLTEVALAAEEWSRCIPALTKWEDDHLLDNPTPDLLEAHKTTIERLMAFGRFISLIASQPIFPDRLTSEMVAATQVILKDKLQMWHGPRMSREEANRILSACFPNES
ncbi:MAG: hypothetical protein HY735_01935 [Verrucomicrobia bacterium]|nr:hypothetical protein [Verrucomicrobiota bacterium]